MKDWDTYIKDDLIWQKWEESKFITPGPGSHDYKEKRHVGTVLINQKSSFSKNKPED